MIDFSKILIGKLGTTPTGMLLTWFWNQFCQFPLCQLAQILYAEQLGPLFKFLVIQIFFLFDFTTNFVCIIYIFKMHKYYIVYTFFRKMCDVIQQSQDCSNLLVLVFLPFKSIIFRVSCERKLSRNFAFFRENELNEKMRKRCEISQKTSLKQ